MSNPNAGMWPVAIIMIVAVSWIFYRYATPQSWREWTGAGLVQAFIIALYAEMYGFPLTLYILTGVLGIDIPWMHQSGHLWATWLGLGPIGSMIEMVVGLTFVFLGLQLIMQGWREVYRARREGRLATTGVYRTVRHPQYSGILIALVGQLIHWPTIPTLVLFPVIAFAYWRLARKEEKAMVATFGDQYRSYQRQVPMFLPRAGDWRRLFGVRTQTRA